LYEISVISAFPAYEGTSVAARSQPLGVPSLSHAQRSLRILELQT